MNRNEQEQLSFWAGRYAVRFAIAVLVAYVTFAYVSHAL